MLRSPYNRSPIVRISHDRGTTLIEMIIYIGIVTVLLAGVTAITGSALDAKIKTETVSEVYAASMGTFGRLEHTLFEAVDILSPTPGATSSVILIQEPSGATTSIALSGGRVVQITGGEELALSPQHILVDAFIAEGIGSAGTSSALRATLELSASTTSLFQPFLYRERFTTTFITGSRR